MSSFYKYIRALLTACLMSCILLTGCGPSEEKIAEAQSKYTELVELHNQVVEAHKTIADDSLDADLVSLSDKLEQMDDFNLNEMKDEEIDTLIASMDTLMTTYQDFLTSITQMKSNEEAAVIVTIPVTLSNTSGLTFNSVMLFEKGDVSNQENILASETTFADTQHITGLFIYRDVTNTPWILALEDADGNSYEIELPVKIYTEEGCTLTLTYDSETQELKCT